MGLNFTEAQILATEAGKLPENRARIQGECDKPKKRNKFNAVKKEIDGITFDSAKEAKRYSELKFMAAAGQISDLECHPKYELYAGITYKPDFRYTENGKTVCEDVKSKPTKTRDFVMRWKMAQDIYKDCEWRMIE